MKSFSLEHFFEPLMDDPSYFTKRMFGGLAVYYNELMVAVITEKIGDRDWKGLEYDFDIWNGILLCTSRKHHASLRKSFKGLCSHPVLGKWLYLPMNTNSFEVLIVEVVEAIEKKDPRLGIVPGIKKRNSKKKSKQKPLKAKKVNQQKKGPTKKIIRKFKKRVVQK